LFVGESAALGLVGSALGLPLGWLLARAAIGPVSRVVSELMVPIDGARLGFTWQLMLLALLSGTLVTVLAAVFPALQAAADQPADAVRRVPRRGAFLAGLLQIAAMIGLLVMGFAAAKYRAHLPPRFGMF